MEKHTKFKKGDLITSLKGISLYRIDEVSPRRANYKISHFDEYDKKWNDDPISSPVYIIDSHYQLYNEEIHVNVHDNPFKGMFD